MADTGEMISGNGDHYEVQWYYGVNGVWFDGGSSDVKMNNATYSVPSNATKVKVTVKPVAKTYKSGDNDVPYWTGEPVTVEKLISELPPNTPSAPTVELDKYTLTAKLENIADAKAEEIEFEVVKGDAVFTTGKTIVKTARAVFTCAIDAGAKYRVRCRAINYISDSPIYSQWSQYSSEGNSIPSAPVNVKVSIETDKSVKVSWDAVGTATGYTVEYTTNKLYFDSSSEVKSASATNNYVIITGIEKGYEYYFRVKATNSKGDSGWSDIVYKIVGTKPEPPTTWSLTTTAIIGDPVILYWTHNSEDASKQYEAQLELLVNGEASIITVDTSEEIIEDGENKIYKYELDLSQYTEGVELYWRVRTRGVSAEYSDWSVQRKIDTYAPPTLSLTLGDGSGNFTSFPFTILANAGPSTQNAISYSVTISAEYSYRTQDVTGQNKIVNAGENVYSKVFVQPENTLSIDLMPSDLILENNQPYKVKVSVSMNSGLTAEAEGIFTVSWAEDIYYPDASVTIDKNSLCAYISPFCYDEESNLISDVVLSVYRREFNGTFTEIATDISNVGSISVTDPHPSLDYARYRIVVRNVNTNVIGFTDLPGIPINEPSIVIQWNEEWSNFDVIQTAAPEIPFYSGSMVKLPYNVDTSESSNVENSLVEYIGRKSPVSYYGTQQGVSNRLNTDIPYYDKETIYALRRLQVWPGDVYIREPNGTGYNANISVSFSIKHLSLTIPVSITVKRVEGGI